MGWLAVKRGDLVVVVAPGDYGKPRPALVIQSDAYNEAHESVVVCLLSSALFDAPHFRLLVEPSPSNGLKRRSQIMIDKTTAIKREHFGDRIGALSKDDMLRVNRTLALWLGLGE